MEEVRKAFGLHEVVFIPAAIPPHKEMEEVIEAHHRLEMVRLATQSNPFFSISNIELTRPGKSYSIDTIRYFRERDQRSLYFILGGDAFVEIEMWKDFQQLFSLCNFIVMTRPGFQNTLFSPPFPESLSSSFRYDQKLNAWIHVSGQTLHFLEITFLDISSTKIRELIESGESVRYLLPVEVDAYIQQHELYRRKNPIGQTFQPEHPLT